MAELDAVIHAHARLRTMTVLATLGEGDTLSFPRLQQLLEMTSGNLATHLRKLEAADYVAVDKVLEGRAPVTYVGLTASGREAFARYKRQLRELLEASG